MLLAEGKVQSTCDDSGPDLPGWENTRASLFQVAAPFSDSLGWQAGEKELKQTHSAN